MTAPKLSEFFIGFLPVVGIGLVLVFSLQVLFAVIERKIKRSRAETTSERINRLSIALNESIELTNEIQEEIEKRHSMAIKLQEDVDRYEKLASIKGSEVEAIAQTLRGELRNESSKSFLQSALISLFFFLAGVGVTLYTNA